MSLTADNPIELQPDAIRINGRSEIMLCASLFYFRIPRALWQERMEQLKACGYNSIDVYFPWNYHEDAEGQWDFGGERDVAAFLRLAKEAGLYVVARPGPYICSEWDGGGLPAYLFAQEQIRLRDNDPRFLRHTARWYERIMPLLADFELCQGGTVIAVQLDNELDFYGCEDPAGYMAALRELARSHGIRSPLLACAGQGGLFEASGYAKGVVPTCNFYPHNRDPEFEAKVLAYQSELAAGGVPLLVTETNRSHFLLRRLLACGAKLLGPYLQASGTNFGFTNATNNWGKPLAFLTSDYDFGGMVAPDGTLRPEAREGRLLASLIAAYGTPLAEAVPSGGDSAAVTVRGLQGKAAGPFALQLKGGGSLLFFANTGSDDAALTLAPANAGTSGEATFFMQPDRCAALPCDLPLSHWGLPGRLAFATAELFGVRQANGAVQMLFHAEGAARLTFEAGEAEARDVSGLKARQADGLCTLDFGKAEIGRCRFVWPSGQTLEIVTMDRELALRLETAEADEENFRFEAPGTGEGVQPAKPLAAEWRLAAIDPAQPLTEESPTPVSQADYLEKHGILRGYGWYQAQLPTVPEAGRQLGFFLNKGSDVLSLYAEGRYLGTFVPGGASKYIPLDDNAGIRSIAVRAEIWGHSNFDDPRLPGLRLNAMKGIRGLAAITRIRELSANWRYAMADPDDTNRQPDVPFLSAASKPIVAFGGWLSGRSFRREWFARSIAASAQTTARVLRFDGLEGTAEVFVNGRSAGMAQPLDPFIDLTALTSPGEEIELSVLLERNIGQQGGRVQLLEGMEATDWRLVGAGEEALRDYAIATRPSASAVEFPVSLAPGAVALLYGAPSDPRQDASAGWRVTAQGQGLKATVFWNGRLVSRLWLPGGDARPTMTGGSPDAFYVPGAWFHKPDEGTDEIIVLLEAVDGGHPAELRGFEVTPL
ncbi:beta-galactosidase [Paenibacillus methanolicus]|uniref:Beta-galactosidase n=1 Tax=Paenibacillus methanolicus TaxID=582686 RepID=A0A5S5CJA9_9BACL|nr:beta-galactosidase [Paenibacillus methanolicus]TYP79869.1 beta-galactosidase [Paenibacillus methanolicus]